MKKFNGQRCERRNLTDLLLGVGPDGKKRQNPAAKKRPKNYAANPPVRKMALGGPGKEDDTFLTGPQKSMYEYLISQGNSPQVALAITSVTQKESAGKATAVEGSYANTSNERIRGINSRFADVFGNMSDEELDALKQDPKAFFNTVYATAAGNTEPDDGYNYRGRGLVQLTGRSNYADLSQALFGDDRLVQNPDLLLDEDVAGKAAGWFALNRGKGVGGYLEFPLDQAELTPEQAQQVLDATYAVIASGGTLPKEKAVPEQMTQKYGQYTTGMPKMQNFYQRGVVQLPRTQLAEIPDQSKIDAERAEMTNFMDMVDRNAALYDLTAETPSQPINVMAPDATNVPMQVPNYLMQRWGGPYKKTYGGYPKMNPGGPVNPNDPQFQSWLNTTGRTFYPEYSGEALSPTEWYKYVNPHNNTQEYPSNIAVDPTLLPQAGDRYMSQQIGRMSSPGAKRMTMADAYQANTERFNTNRETQRLYEDWLSRQSGPETRGVVTTVADDGLSFMRTGAASDLKYGGYPQYNMGGPSIDPALLARLQAAQGSTPDYSSMAAPSNDRLTGYNENQLRTYENNVYMDEASEQMRNIGTGLSNAVQYAANNPLDATQVGLGALAIGADAIPFGGNIVSAVADGTNALISTGRSSYYNLTGDPAKSAFYGGMAVLDTAAAVPGVGNYAGATKIGALLNKGLHAAHPASKAVTVGKGGNMLGEGMTYKGTPQMNYGGPGTPNYYAYGDALDQEYAAMQGSAQSVGQGPNYWQRFQQFLQLPNMQNLDPGQVPNAMNEMAKKQGQIATASGLMTSAGTMISNSELASKEGGLGTATSAAGGALSGVGAVLPYAAAVPGLAPFAAVAGAMYGAYKKKDAEYKQDRAYQEQLQEEADLRLDNSLDYSRQMANTYDDSGQMVNSYMAKYGGSVAPDYETEKSEVILAGFGDKPVAMGQGKYNRMSQNIYRANGPSHEYGGIPTKGATMPFIDSVGNTHNSPYVFSDSKDMRFDATNILKMIS